MKLAAHILSENKSNGATKPRSMAFLSELHIGRAGEHIAAADIMTHGFECFPAAQGMPYDLIADIGGRLLKVQVKTTAKVRAVPQRREHIPAYLFWINRCGKKGRSVYSDGEVDLFALVALEEKAVGYLAPGDLPTTLVIRTERHRGKYNDEVLSERNNKVVNRISNGETAAKLCAETGLDKAYVHRLINGKGYLKGAGVYLADLPLEKALGEGLGHVVSTSLFAPQGNTEAAHG